MTDAPLPSSQPMDRSIVWRTAPSEALPVVAAAVVLGAALARRRTAVA